MKEVKDNLSLCSINSIHSEVKLKDKCGFVKVFELSLVKISVQETFNAKRAPRLHVINVKASVFLLAVSIVILLSVTLISLGVAAQSSDYDFNDAWQSDGPTVTFYVENATAREWIELKSENPVIYSDTDNITLRVHVSGPSYLDNAMAQDDIRWWMGYLTSVSYKAGWQYNKNIQVYSNTSNDGEKTLDFELTNIPHYGKHTLEVGASCVVFVFGGGRTQYTFRTIIII